MTTYDRGQELAEILNAADIYATTDPAEIDGPTVLVTPPSRKFDVMSGLTVTWSLYVIVPGPGNGEAWKQLDATIDDVTAVFDVESAEPISYNDQPAARLVFNEVIDR